MTVQISARRVADIDWGTWQPVDLATLTFVVRAHEVLLIRKKRGLGAGKINGPGGRVEGDETIAQCAVREVEEELHVTPLDPDKRGELLFQFVDGYSLHCHVFRSERYQGEACETEEAIPLWTPRDAIPFDEMWADDYLWLPRMLDGDTFQGRFIFDGDEMLDYQLDFGV